MKGRPLVKGKKGSSSHFVLRENVPIFMDYSNCMRQGAQGKRREALSFDFKRCSEKKRCSLALELDDHLFESIDFVLFELGRVHLLDLIHVHEISYSPRLGCDKTFKEAGVDFK